MKETRTDAGTQTVRATLDGLRTITVRFPHPVASLTCEQVKVRDSSGADLHISEVAPLRKTIWGRARSYAVRLVHPPNIERQTLEIEIDGRLPQPVLLGRILCSKRFYDAEARLGATYSPQGTLFGVFAPTAEGVDVVVAGSRTGRGVSVHPMTRNRRGVWSATVQGDLRHHYYSYKLRGPGLDPQREVTDVYANCAQYPGKRSMILDLHETDPPAFDAAAHVDIASPTDAIVYEMHVRDFTIAASAGVKNRGRYLGLTESGTHLPGDRAVKTGLDHLVELGVTHVQLMPVQCFQHSDGYNWGYMTVFFNTPEGRYATDPRSDAPTREFKRAVQAFHERGIGVVLDVVYNHASSHATFEQLAPAYYFRMKSDGGFWDGSGCGNEFHTENPMARKFILDSLKYWVTEFGIDGFRFDLMGLIGLKTLELIRDELRSVHPSILLYGEPWAAGATGLRRVTDKHAIRGKAIGAFNDHYRNAIKGDPDGDQPGFIQAGDRIDAVRAGILGSIHDWALHPAEVINYCACHDNLTTWDKLLKTAPDASDQIRKRMQRLAGLMLMTSQGVPFLHSGQELCRTKQGHTNSYDLPDEINRIDWSLKRANMDVFTYYRDLIALRKAHPVFRLRTRDEVERRVHLMNDVPTGRCIAFALDGRGLPGERFFTTLVLLNGDRSDQTFALGPGRWLLVADADRASETALAERSGSVTVAAHSGMILHK